MSTIREVLNLPDTPPRCVVEIGTFEERDKAKQLLDEFVLTDELRHELLGGPEGKPPGLLPRLRASVKQNASGDGHWIHGSFGSGKSHFMGILGLLLSDLSSVCRHPVLGEALGAGDRAWLAENPFLCVPVFMLGADNLERQIYTAVNESLARHGQPPCPFYDVEASLALFEKELTDYGEIAFEKRLMPFGVDCLRYDQLRADESGKFELATVIRQAYGIDQLDNARGLYPKDMVAGMVALSKHVVDLGYAGVMLLIDELILYLRTKSGQTWKEEIASLGCLVDDTGGRACPIWVMVTRQRDIRETRQSDQSEKDIHDELQRLSERFPYETRLEDHDLVPIVRERVLRPRDEHAKARLEAALDTCLHGLDAETRRELAGQWGEQALRDLYPFHPALLQTLVDLGNQLSRERTALSVLYQLLIVKHPDLTLGRMVPYHSVFDVVLPPGGGLLSGGPRHAPALEAAQKLYYQELQPVIDRLWADSESERKQVEVAVKTVLLCQLTRDSSSHITLARIVHLNREELQTRYAVATYATLRDLLARLAHECPNVLLRGESGPGADVEVAISVHEGLSLDRDILPHVPISPADVARVFQDLLARQLVQDFDAMGVIKAYRHIWRGTERPARIRLANVAEVDIDTLTVEPEFTLVIGQPYDPDPQRAAGSDDVTIDRAQKRLGVQPLGFWLPVPFTAAERSDLETLARLDLLAGHDPQASEIQTRLLGHLVADERERLTRQALEFRDTKRGFLARRIDACYMRDGARCVFLDGRIRPNLDAASLQEAMGRISNEALDRLHPQHPSFPTLVQAGTLQDFLSTVALPMLQSDKPLKLDAKTRNLVSTVAQPLGLGTAGAEWWSLDKGSQYLRRALRVIDDTGKTDDLIADLQGQYGFQAALTDIFILLLIHGFGYRAFRDQKAVPVPDLRPGRLKGLRLYRGQLVAAPTWSEAKRRLGVGWSTPACRAHLGLVVADLDQARQANRSLPAQDDLWRVWRSAARTLREPLKRGRATLGRLEAALGEAAVAARRANLDRSDEVNAVVLNGADESQQALEQVTAWQPPEGAADEWLGQLGPAASFDAGLQVLNNALLDQVAPLRERSGAEDLLHRLAQHVNNVGQEGQLTSRIEAWNHAAQAWVQQQLTATPPPLPPPVEAGPADDGEPDGPADETVIVPKIACHRANLAETVDALRERAVAELDDGAARVIFSLEVKGGDA